jgi:putative NADH-flavin reductase
MIAAMAAAGNTGRKISESLLKLGEKVRALGRSAGKLTELRQLTADLSCPDSS